MADLMAWHGSPREAIALQTKLREQVRIEPLTKPIKRIGGCDVSMNRFATQGYAGFVALSYPACELIESVATKAPIAFPYIPGLLSFREIPMLTEAWKLLAQKPDVIVVDGVGIAHPRRIGIATHLGLVLNVPTIGCAKSVLTGTYKEPGIAAGSVSYLYDPKNPDEIIGAALRTKRNVKPVFISPGHRITLEESLEIIRSCVRKHRLPEPTRLAHLSVNAARIHEK